MLKNDDSVQVGVITGADYGRIHFKDIDGDGVKETIIETQLPLFDTGEYYADTITVLRYISGKDGQAPRLEEMLSEVRGEQEW